MSYSGGSSGDGRGWVWGRVGGKLEEQEKHLLSVCVVSTKGMDKETPYIFISGTG